MEEVDVLDSSSDDVCVSAVSVIYAKESLDDFQAFTLLFERNERNLIGYDDDDGWVPVWNDGDGGSYEEASEEWMTQHHSHRFDSSERYEFQE